MSFVKKAKMTFDEGEGLSKQKVLEESGKKIQRKEGKKNI